MFKSASSLRNGWSGAFKKNSVRKFQWNLSSVPSIKKWQKKGFKKKFLKCALKKKCQKKVPKKYVKCALKKKSAKKKRSKVIHQVCPPPQKKVSKKFLKCALKVRKNCPKEKFKSYFTPYFHHWSPISRFGAGWSKLWDIKRAILLPYPLL